MNYIWEIVLRAKESDISEADLFFKQALECSPYYEQSFFEIDKSSVDEVGAIEVNAIYRFDKIFNLLLQPDLEENIELKQYIYDIAMHFLVNVDLYSGLTRKDIFILKMKESLQKGQYGEQITATFNKLSHAEKNIISIHLLEEVRLGSSLKLFRELLKKIYPDMLLYQMKTGENLVLLYLGIKENAWEHQRLELLLDLFLPLKYKIRVFWEHHFGVIDIDETMRLDNIELF